MPLITRPRTRGYKTVIFARQRARACASGVHLCHLRHFRAVTERIGSGYGADQSASLLYDRGETERENVGAGCFCARLRARIMHVRESGERYHIFTNEKV